MRLEDADAVLERADDRRLERPAGPAIGPVDRPGLRLGMEEADRRAGEPAAEVGLEGVDVAETAEERPRFGDRRDVEPLVAAGETLAEPPSLHVPAAHEEVEIVCG